MSSESNSCYNIQKQPLEVFYKKGALNILQTSKAWNFLR